eukprot:4567148-Heterocapsa_arctica.AAC.1
MKAWGFPKWIRRAAWWQESSPAEGLWPGASGWEALPVCSFGTLPTIPSCSRWKPRSRSPPRPTWTT